MKLLNSITIKNLKSNKKRTIVTIIGIILSVALICAITSFVVSFQKALVEREIKKGGNYHITVENLTEENKKYIENNVKVDKIGYKQAIGYAKIPEIQNENKPYVYIEAFDDYCMKNRGLILIEGRMPENENEIVIPEHLEANGGVKYSIGDKITLNIGNRYIEGEKLNQNNPYLTDEDIESRKEQNMEESEEIEQEEFIVEEAKEYTIVGKIERPTFEEYSAPGYTVITKLENINYNQNVGMLITLKNPSEAYSFTQYLENDLKIDGAYINTNDTLLQYLGVFKSVRTNDFIIMMAGIVIVIILFTSAFVIRNSFNISLTEKTRELGMLASIGATSKQIRKSIFFEGAVLAIISIPLGIIVGIASIGIVLAVVNSILNSGVEPLVDNFDLKLVISWEAIGIAVLVSIIMIIISIIKPSIRAGRITPIDAIREKSDIKISKRQQKKQSKGKGIKEYKITKKLFGIEGVIARKNFKRSKKKYRTTIFSIFLSIVLFISMNSVIENLFNVSSLKIEPSGYNLTLYSGGQNNNQALEYFNKIAKLDGIKEYAIETFAYLYIDPNLLDEKAGYSTNVDAKADVGILAYSLGDECYRNYIKELGLNYEDVKNKAILYDTIIANIHEEGKDGIKRVEYNMLKVNQGDILQYVQHDEKTDEPINKSQIEIALRTTKMPMDGLFSNNNTAILIVSDEYINNLQRDVTTMCINAEDPYKLEQEIIPINPYNKTNIFNLEEDYQSSKNMELIISIFLYGFIIVISIIGITNIFNTITTNMALRTREFAILKSIGMTNKEFRRMINYESFIYGAKSLIYGIPVGIILSYLIFNVTGTIYETEYHLPIVPILISIIFVFVIIFITMQYSVSKTKNQNIIETIRKENI